MDNIVLDTSALIAALLNEPEKQRLIELTEGMTLIAPASHRWELGNAFSAMFRKGRLNLEEALDALDVYEEIPIRSVDVNLGRALEVAKGLGIYAYDAYMIVCAVDYKSPLLTLDRALAKQAKSCGVCVPEI